METISNLVLFWICRLIRKNIGNQSFHQSLCVYILFFILLFQLPLLRCIHETIRVFWFRKMAASRVEEIDPT